MTNDVSCVLCVCGRMSYQHGLLQRPERISYVCAAHVNVKEPIERGRPKGDRMLLYQPADIGHSR
jgi:hypothetical protein